MNEGEKQALAALRGYQHEHLTRLGIVPGHESEAGRPEPEAEAAPCTDFDAGAREAAAAPPSEAEFLLAVLDRHHGGL